MYKKSTIEQLNSAIANNFSHIQQIQPSDKKHLEGVSRLVMLDRYSLKDKALLTLSVGDLVVTTIKEDPRFPSRGMGLVTAINADKISIKVEEQYWASLTSAEQEAGGVVVKSKTQVEKPMELFFEQIARRVGKNLASFEKSEELKAEWTSAFQKELGEMNIVPAGRVLHGAGSDSQVTFFNCYVMPMPNDSRGGLADHRKEVMEIMSRGGGVGTNGSTLRPKGAAAISVGGRSSGSVSWLNDLSSLTNLVEQGGSRRGAQMIMLADWHPDIVEFIVSKMQNPKILKFLQKNLKSDIFQNEINRKLKFNPLSMADLEMYSSILERKELFSTTTVKKAQEMLNDGGEWDVINPDFLTGANISVAHTREFMAAVENNAEWNLRFPDVANFNKEQKAFYDAKWHEMGDVREWEKMGYPVKSYATIPAKELWTMINTCATYSAEPGVFFIDRANEMTNAVAYGQKVVCTNPCGEQPLAPYSVCNLAALNLANFVNKETQEVQYDKLAATVKVCTRLQDNVIDATPYFLDVNEKQAKGERRLGMGIMGLHDLLIYAGVRYGSVRGNEIINKVMETIALTSYRASVDLAKEKGVFPFLKNNKDLLKSGYITKTLPKDLQEDIGKYGLRNSHILTIAPTGSTGTMVGVSTGLEPYFAFKYYRSGRLGKFMEVEQEIVKEYLSLHDKEGKYSSDNLPDIFVSSMQLTPEEHADVQIVIQKWVDSSISKTVNAPKGYTVEQVEKVYSRLYAGGAKGGTVYVDGSRDAQVLSLSNSDEKETEQLGLDDGNIDLMSLIRSQAEQAEIAHAQTQSMTSETGFSDPIAAHNARKTMIGIDVGNTCPVCEKGTVEDIGGCNTCTNCSAQLKCGL